MRPLCFLDEPIYAAVHVHIIDPDDPDISEPPINYFLQVEMRSLNAHKLTTRYMCPLLQVIARTVLLSSDMQTSMS